MNKIFYRIQNFKKIQKSIRIKIRKNKLPIKKYI